MTEVATLLDKRNIKYKNQGNDLVVACLNPEHEDTNPSMRINAHTGVFHCFSCGYKGNLFKEFGEPDIGLEIDRTKLIETIEEKERENIGLSFPKGASIYNETFKGIKKETLENFRAFTHNDFGDRVMFPITNITGNTVVFHGRHIDPFGKPKYLNYPKKVQLPMFPAKPEQYNSSVILVEGLFDFLNLYQHGLTNGVTCFGTTSVTREKLLNLKIQGVTKLIIFFDDDNAIENKNPGQENAEKVRQLADTLGFITVNVKWPSADPGSLTKKQVQSIRKQLYEDSFN